MKIVLDTNVLISAIFWGGKPIRIFDLITENKVSLYATAEIMREYFRVIEKIGKNQDSFVNSWKMKLMDIVKIVETTICVKDCRDPKDNMFLECALATYSQIIVSGDKDLLTLHPYRGIEILKINEFLKRFDK